MLKASAFVLAAFVSISVAACAASSDEDASAAAGSSAVSATAPLTLDNWLSHPKVVAVRKEVDAIDSKNLKSEDKDNLCNDIGESERSKLTDAAGVIRELVETYGGDDGVDIVSSYYDARGTLRFVFETANDVHGNSSETRTYFDEYGTQFWSVFKHAYDANLHPDLDHAPYTLTDPSASLDANIADPAKMWAAAPSCD